jgi:hypothetical protein
VRGIAGRHDAAVDGDLHRAGAALAAAAADKRRGGGTAGGAHHTAAAPDTLREDPDRTVAARGQCHAAAQRDLHVAASTLAGAVTAHRKSGPEVALRPGQHVADQATTTTNALRKDAERVRNRVRGGAATGRDTPAGGVDDTEPPLPDELSLPPNVTVLPLSATAPAPARPPPAPMLCAMIAVAPVPSVTSAPLY